MPNNWQHELSLLNLDQSRWVVSKAAVGGSADASSYQNNRPGWIAVVPDTRKRVSFANTIQNLQARVR